MIGTYSEDKLHLNENLPVFRTLFDKIYVVSLPQSLDRRSYVSKHLSDSGIPEFEFHNALAPDNPITQSYLQQGQVHQFPPCFRCGKKDCGKKDCNNVLIGPQIATFATYLELWKKIAATPQRALVLEDDVKLHPYTGRVLEELALRVQLGELEFSAHVPRLFRLGWALCVDHDDMADFRIDDVVKMSNPCHALSSGFAQKLLDNFQKIETTPDIFMHSIVPGPGEAATIFPPIASELSWSEGSFQSLIHPKIIRTKYLERQGETELAEEQKDIVSNHHQHMYHRKILVVGHPRTGTGYSASILRQMGLDIGHEKSGKDGLSSWMFAAEADEYPYAQDRISRSRKMLHWDLLLLPVRDIATAIPSIMRDSIRARPSYDFRREHILKALDIDLDNYANDFERAVVSLICWVRMILAMQPDLWFRIEDGHGTLEKFLAARGLVQPAAVPELDTSPVNAEKHYQGQWYPKPEITAADWEALTPDSKALVQWYCNRFSYPLPFKKATIEPAEPNAARGLERLFLQPSGWALSHKNQRPVRSDGVPVPWFTYGAIEFLHRTVHGGMQVFEYGAGYSTLWWQRAARVHSIDHDPDWVAEIRPQLEPNVTLSLVERHMPPPPGADTVLAAFQQRPHRTDWTYEPERVVRRGLEDDSFLAYAAKVRDSGLAYDVIVIDGMARRLCTEFAVDCLAETGMIILDNSNRSDYDAAYDILHEAGFFQIPFWGLVPGADFLTCTSIFLRNINALPGAGFSPNSFGLPEY